MQNAIGFQENQLILQDNKLEIKWWKHAENH